MADAAAQIPWLPIIGCVTLIVTAVIAGFGILYRALAASQQKRIDELEEDKDFWKDKAAGRIIADREHRIRVETEELGAPSVAPPPRNRQDSRPLIIASAEDEAWQRQRERSREWERLQGQRRDDSQPPLDAFGDARTAEERRKSRVDRELRKFTADGESTPPDPLRRRR